METKADSWVSLAVISKLLLLFFLLGIAPNPSGYIQAWMQFNEVVIMVRDKSGYAT
jgi:hypothetical protein